MSFAIRFLPDDRRWRADESVDLAFAAASCGILLEQPCGSRLTCGKCRVRVTDGAPPAASADLSVLGAAAIMDGWRLGCRLQFGHAATVEIPQVSRSVASKGFGDDTLLDDDFGDGCNKDGLGLAIDVGSTTLAVALVQLRTGAVIASASALNPQIRFGGDVLTRIAYAQANRTGLDDLHDALAAALRDLTRTCVRAASIAVSEVRDATLVGNPTMLHTLRHLDPTPLGLAPYRGACEASWHGSARPLGLDLPVEANAYLPPGVRSHVGADTVAAILATRLDRVERPTLLVDLGTNSEVVLAWYGRILCASTSAGPAFEGANIHHGMRGAPGAIEEVRISSCGSLLVRTIGGTEPRGICGTGLIDAAAELLRANVLEQSGRMRSADELTSLAPPRLAERVIEIDGVGRAVWLAGTRQQPVLLTAADVRQLQLVKASIAAGIRVLLERAELCASDLDAILLAGAFGNYLRKQSALAIGLVPPVDPERVRFVGNAAGVGARLLLVDHGARARAELVAANAGYVELGGATDYASAFVNEMSFPCAAWNSGEVP